MGLSRRRFTREFKMAAIERLEQGVSMGEVARALEVNPNVLQRWRRGFRQGPGRGELGKRGGASFSRPPSAAPAGADPDMNLRDAIQRIALEFPSYGRPRITAEVKRRRWEGSKKRVQRNLREG